MSGALQPGHLLHLVVLEGDAMSLVSVELTELMAFIMLFVLVFVSVIAGRCV